MNAKQKKTVTSAVKAFYESDFKTNKGFNDGMALLIPIMLSNGVAWSDTDSVRNDIGVSLGYVLTKEKIAQVVIDTMTDKTKPKNFLDVLILAKNMDLDLSQTQKQELVQKHFKTSLKELSEFTRFYKEHGVFAEVGGWILEHPDFTHVELYSADVLGDLKSENPTQREKYLNQFLGFQAFFKDVDSKAV